MYRPPIRGAAGEPLRPPASVVLRLQLGDRRGREFTNGGKQRRRLEPPAVVAPHVGKTYGSIAIDDESRRRREAPALIPVQLRQFDASSLVRIAVCPLDDEDESVARCNFRAEIAEHCERQLKLLGERERVVGRHRRHSDEPDALLLQLTEDLPVGIQLQVAVRAPRAAVERQDDRAVFEQSAERDLAAVCCREREPRCLLADVDRLRREVATTSSVAPSSNACRSSAGACDLSTSRVCSVRSRNVSNAISSRGRTSEPLETMTDWSVV